MENQTRDLLLLWLGCFCLVGGLFLGAMQWFYLKKEADVRTSLIPDVRLPPSAKKQERVWAMQPLGVAYPPQKKASFGWLGKHFGVKLRWLPVRDLPYGAYHSVYRRFRADRLCRYLARWKPLWAERTIGLTNVDISTNLPGFRDHAVFGLSDRGGPAAIISSFRLRSLSKHPNVKRAWRALILHEAGHLRSLQHCHDTDCAMLNAHGSLSLFLRASPKLCSRCQRLSKQ